MIVLFIPPVVPMVELRTNMIDIARVPVFGEARWRDVSFQGLSPVPCPLRGFR